MKRLFQKRSGVARQPPRNTRRSVEIADTVHTRIAFLEKESWLSFSPESGGVHSDILHKYYREA